MEIKNKTENMKIQRMVTNQEERMVTPSACLQQVALQKHHGTERHRGEPGGSPIRHGNIQSERSPAFKVAKTKT